MNNDKCGNPSTEMQSGIQVCPRCKQEFCSVGFGAAFFDGSWHGVIGATYNNEQAQVFPGLKSQTG